MPNKIIQFVVPVISNRVDQELRAWECVGHGLDLGVAQTMSANNVYVRSFKAAELMEQGRAAVTWDNIDLTHDSRSARKGEARWKSTTPQKVFGFAYWWTTELFKGNTLSTAPTAPATHWEQLYFPLLSPIALKASEQLALSLRSRSSESAGTHLAWTATQSDVRGNQIARQALDLDKGFLP